MKKIFRSITLAMLAILAATITFGQSPQKINYQAVVRDGSGNILPSQNVGIRLSVHDITPVGVIVYQETHNVTTNSLGLVNIEIGTGTVISGTFAGISWNGGNKFLEVEMDPAGGSSYTSLGTSQLISVPYALHSETVTNADDADASPTNELQTISKSGSTVTLSNSGGSFTDAVNDADASATNELQTLSIAGSNLSISSGNTVPLPGLPSGSSGATIRHNGISWVSNTSMLFNNGATIGIGTTSPSSNFKLHVDGSSAVKAEGSLDANGYLGVAGTTDFDGITTLDVPGNEIGVIGASTGSSITDNYGVFGHSNNIGVWGEYSTTARHGYLGSSSYGAYGQYSSSLYGYLGSNSLGAYGQYNANNYGYLGSFTYGVYGTTSTTGTGYGGRFSNTSSGSGSYGVYASAAYTGASNPSTTYALYATSTSTTQNQRGIYNNVDHTGTSGLTYGQYNDVDVVVGNTSSVRGIYVDCDRGGDNAYNYGTYTSASQGTTVYGIYAYGFGGSSATYAGYFSGNLAYTGSLISVSDRKFKENLLPIDGALNKIKQLNTYSYTFKESGDAAKMNFSKGRQFGFIAQEVEDLFPELISDNIHTYDVTVNEGEKEVEEVMEIEYKGVNYIGMIPILTEAIKEQQLVIEDLQNQINELKAMVQTLKK